jgi:hypothetical protein
MMTEGPDREALVAAMIDAAERRDDETTPFYEALADAVLALLPTMPAPGCPSGRCEHRADAHTTHPAGLCLIRGCPCPTPPAPGEEPETLAETVERFRIPEIPPAPGDQPCAECGVEENRHGTVDGCSGFRPLPAPGDGEGLRAEREHFVRAAAVNVGQDIMAADVRFLFDRLDEARAALAARDTGQGAGDALRRSIEALLDSADPDLAYQHVNHAADDGDPDCGACWVHDLRTALARATPEAGEHNPDECAKHRGCYQ